MEQDKTRTWAQVHLEHIRRNVRAMRAVLPEGTKFLGVVKADGYGHGAVPVAKAVLEAGAEYLAVACLPEAATLRDAGITAPILILGITPPELAGELERLQITQAVSSPAYAQALSQALHGPLKVHMKLDTGMSRTGFCTTRPEAFSQITRALTLPKLDFEGVFTHFAVSDTPGAQAEAFTREQHSRFIQTVEQAQQAWGKRFALVHCANSGAVLTYREYAHDMVRPGVLTYGMFPDEARGGLELFPALELKSRVYALTDHQPGDTVSYGRTFTAERPTRLAVVPIGYADGLHRALSGKLEVLIRGRRCPQVGRICMDMCMVDVTELPACAVGDVVTIIGRDGEETILADELAQKAGTINYEITCALTPRVPRVYD